MPTCLQGHFGRARHRTMHVSPSTASGGHTHLNGHAEPDSDCSPPASAAHDLAKKRLQPIGADAKPSKVTEEKLRMNGIAKHSSVVADSTVGVKRSPQSSLTLSLQHSSREERSLTNSTLSADQAPTDTGLQPQFLPPIV